MKTWLSILFSAAILAAIPAWAEESASDPKALSWKLRPGGIVLLHGGQRVGEYVYQDESIPRPYFANLHAPGGVQVTRHHPPRPDQDPTDHEHYHPGIWLAFGDLSGQDSWRNKAAIRHERFTESPSARDGRLIFATESRVLTTDGQALCALHSHFTLSNEPAGYLLIWDAVFAADQKEIVFGDQEEMGLGVRVATPIIEKNGGKITSSSGLTMARNTWGKAFDWCNYSGQINGQQAGITLMPDPENFRPSWFHNRNYGLMVANPFGRKAMKQGEASRVTVKQGKKLRLRFGILLHAAPIGQKRDLASAYQEFLKQCSMSNP